MLVAPNRLCAEKWIEELAKHGQTSRSSRGDYKTSQRSLRAMVPRRAQTAQRRRKANKPIIRLTKITLRYC